MEKSHRVVRFGPISLLVFISVFSFFVHAPHGSARSKEEASVLVIYTSKDGGIDEYQRSLDMLISHFTKDVTFVSSEDVKKDDLRNVTHLFYYGQVATELPARFTTLFDDYDGTFVAIGYNVDMLGDQFSFVTPLHEREINELYITNKKGERLDVRRENIIEIKVTEDTEILIEGKKTGDRTSYPVFVKNDQRYYYAVDHLASQKSVLFAELLHDVFNVHHEAKHPAYIRLEDIHPFVDYENVRQIAEILKEKNIPYMVAVIPVYTNPETGKKHYFSDSPKLLNVLKQMQKDGASIVLHGYTHQFRDSETGEGFEFWDVERNTPIYAPPNQPFTLLEENDFKSKEEYENYIATLKSIETDYVKTKVTRGIQELVNYGLYPLAFEAPHYTMSQNGYTVISEHFSTYVGQIQLSDEDWKIMDSSPYITSPSFLNGMQLLPETMGYVNPEDPHAIENVIKNAESYQLTSDGILSAFYHPYLGVEKFVELISEMEKLPNISWIDLKATDLWVKADHIEIYTENGEIKTKIDHVGLLRSSIDFPLFHFKKFIDTIVWGIALISGITVFVFVMITIFIQTKKAKMEG